jgi:thiamine transport system substrate-binding protein
MRSPEAQKQMQTEMWMYPVDSAVARAEVMQFAPEPAKFDSPSDQDIADKGAAWVARWTKVVLK